jgi:hypothetical protein
MINNMKLQEIEKKAWNITHEDGIIDIVLGMLLIVFAVASVLRAQIGLWYIPIVVLCPGLFAMLFISYGKRNITTPRIGMAKFGLARTASQKRTVRLSMVTLIILIVLVTLTALSTFDVISVKISGYKVPLAIAAGVLVLLTVKARLLGIPRLEIYGIILGSCILSVEILRNYIGEPWHNVISWGVPGAAVLLYGIYRMKTFMNKYPLPEREPSKGSI